jgi:hypothetical protein
VSLPEVLKRITRHTTTTPASLEALDQDRTAHPTTRGEQRYFKQVHEQTNKRSHIQGNEQAKCEQASKQTNIDQAETQSNKQANSKQASRQAGKSNEHVMFMQNKQLHKGNANQQNRNCSNKNQNIKKL